MFSRFSGLIPNSSKCGIAGIGVLKEVKVAKYGIYYNEKLKVEENFCLIIANIQRVLKLWKLRNLTVEGKILIFNTLALSKIIFQAFVTPTPI